MLLFWSDAFTRFLSVLLYSCTLEQFLGERYVAEKFADVKRKEQHSFPSFVVVPCIFLIAINRALFTVSLVTPTFAKT